MHNHKITNRPRATSSRNQSVNKTSVPGLLTGEGGRKLAGMDLSRSFCSAIMKGSFRCSEGRRERENAGGRSVSQLWMKAQRCTLRTCTGEKKKKLFLVSECTFINSSVSLTPGFQLDLCQGYWGGCFNTVALIFQLNSRAHHECQFCRLQLPGRCAPPHHGLTVLIFT